MKDDYESLCSDGKNVNQNHKLIEEIKKKNFEIRELEKEYKNIISSKSEDAQLEYYKKKVNDLKTQNDESKAKINQLKQIVEKHQKKENENKKNSNLNSLSATQLKNNQAKIEKLKIKKEGKIEYIINDSNSKKYILNKNFSLLFNDLEKKTLCTLFQKEEDFIKFIQKFDTMANIFNSSTKRFKSNINELKESNDDKEELIAFLREKIRENEMKIKILLNQVHFERNKNEKRTNYLLQSSNDKSNMNKTREKSLKN